jgi:Thaumatin family
MGHRASGHRRRGGSPARWIGAVAVALVLIAAVLVQLNRGSGGGTDPAASSGVSAPASARATASPTASAFATITPTPTPTPSSTPTPTHTTPATTAPAQPPAAPAGERQITLVNAVNETIWAATNQNSQYPIPVTGWELAPGQSVTFEVANAWGGRIWGRTGCDFDSAGNGHCQTGDCGNVFQCKGSGATPATLAEMTLGSFDGLDFYDVSLVDGSNLPMYINTSHSVSPDPVSPTGCYEGTCTSAINCPTAMQVMENGQAVACETACAAFGGDAYCCTGAWAGRANCLPANWPVDYAKLVFKDAEPYAYSYAYDDSATMTCKGGCDYRITFGITPGG